MTIRHRRRAALGFGLFLTAGLTAGVAGTALAGSGGQDYRVISSLPTIPMIAGQQAAAVGIVQSTCALPEGAPQAAGRQRFAGARSQINRLLTQQGVKLSLPDGTTVTAVFPSFDEVAFALPGCPRG